MFSFPVVEPLFYFNSFNESLCTFAGCYGPIASQDSSNRAAFLYQKLKLHIAQESS